MNLAFVLDAYSREIVGWQVANHLRASLAHGALDKVLSARLRAGDDVPGVNLHGDRRVQYGSISCGETLAESEVVASVGSRGDSYDNAMAEVLNSVFKAELIDRRAWSALADVIVETSTRIGWCNNGRLRSALGHRPSREVYRVWPNCQTYAA